MSATKVLAKTLAKEGFFIEEAVREWSGYYRDLEKYRKYRNFEKNAKKMKKMMRENASSVGKGVVVGVATVGTVVTLGTTQISQEFVQATDGLDKVMNGYNDKNLIEEITMSKFVEDNPEDIQKPIIVEDFSKDYLQQAPSELEVAKAQFRAQAIEEAKEQEQFVLATFTLEPQSQYIAKVVDMTTKVVYEISDEQLEQMEQLLVKRENPIAITQKAYEKLCGTVQAEAGGEGFWGQVLVAFVALNRVDITGKDVISILEEENQFAKPKAYSEVTDVVKSAVNLALEYEDITGDLLKIGADQLGLGEEYCQGAQWFYNPQKCSQSELDKRGQIKIQFSYKNHWFYGVWDN